MSYDSVVKKQEVWRVLTAMLSHQDIFHLLLNLTVLYEAAVLEAEWGSFLYFKAHVVIVSLSSASALVFDRLLLKLLRQSTLAQSIRNRYIIGYSPVVFGFVLILSQRWSVFEKTMDTTGNSPFWSNILNRRGEEIFQTLSGIPLVVILCAQLLLDHTSFVYHIAGILFGSLVYAGAFDWLTQYWFFSSMIWIGFAMCFTLSRIPTEDLPWVLRFVKSSFKFETARLVRVVVKHGDDEYSAYIPQFSLLFMEHSSSDEIQDELETLLENDRRSRRRRRRTSSASLENIV